MVKMTPSQNDGIPSPTTENSRTAWSAGRSWCVAARAAKGTVMTIEKIVATRTRAAVMGMPGASTEATGSW